MLLGTKWLFIQGYLDERTAVNDSKLSVKCNENLYATPYQMFLKEPNTDTLYPEYWYSLSFETLVA